MDLPAPFTLLQITPALDTGGVERTTLDIAEAVVKAIDFVMKAAA